jgi:hypothetical protein
MNRLKLLKVRLLVFISSMVILLPVMSSAQDSKFELSPFAGYMLGGSIKFYEGKFKIQNSASYGGMLAYRLGGGNLIELSYTRMDSQGDWRPYSGYIDDFPEKTVDVAMNYIQIGTVNELMTGNDQLRPYGTFSLGAAWLHGKETNAQDEWLFAVNAGVGLKYFFGPRIGIRLQARLMLPLVFSGAGFYLGVGTGGPSAGVGVGSFAPIVQGDFTGGLIIALGD